MSTIRSVTQLLGSAAQAWYVRLTDGTNTLGVAATPLRIDPTGTTPQPVSGTVAVTGVATETTLGQIKAKTDNIPSSPATDRTTAGAPFAVRLSDGAAFLGVALETTLSAIKTLLDTTGIKVLSGAITETNSGAILTRQSDGTQKTKLSDAYGFTAELTPIGEQRSVSPVKLVGAMLDGATVDARFWTTAVGASGTVTQGSGQQTVTCGVNAAGYGLINSNRAGRYVAGSSNRYRAQIQLGDTGIADNARYWGVAVNAGTTISDGAYFKLSGTTLQIVTKLAGDAEVPVSSASWNTNTTVPTLTNCNTYEIYWTNKSVYFVINDVLMHKVSALTATWASTMTFKLFHANINTGNTADKSLLIRVAAISRLGEIESSPTIFRITAAGTNILKRGAGDLHHIFVGKATGTVIQVYDGLSAAGTLITEVDVPNNANCFDIPIYGPFSDGLTIVTTGTWDLTVVYE